MFAFFFQFDGAKGFFNYMASAGLYDFSYPRNEKRVVPSSKWPNYYLFRGFCDGITFLNHNESFLLCSREKITQSEKFAIPEKGSDMFN